MNYPIAFTFGLICLVILAHLFGGIRESLTVRPSVSLYGSSDKASFYLIERSWVQLMCAFQLVSVDLVVIAVVLYLLAFTNYFHQAEHIAFGMAMLFAAWGIVWLVQLFSLRRVKTEYLKLGQWVLWFVSSGLMLWGAKTL